MMPGALARLLASRAAAQAVLWLTFALPLFLAMAGLAIDGGALLDSRRDLQSIADGAARAGATRLDMARLRASAGADVQLDPSEAVQVARSYLDRSFGADAHAWNGLPQADIQVGPRRVQVLIHANVATAFLRIVFIESVPVQASAVADVQFGIHNGSGG